MTFGADERQESLLKGSLVREIEACATDLRNELAGGGMYMARRLYHIEQKTEQFVYVIRYYLSVCEQSERPPVDADIEVLLNPRREGLAEVTD